MKIIYANSERYGRQEIFVDDSDYDHLNQWIWSIKRCGKDILYAQRYFIHVRRNLSMHRYLMGLNREKILVDHKDHNGLNNQRCNLRLCNHSQNGANRKCGAIGVVGFIGVTEGAGRSKPFDAAIRRYDKRIYLGNFSTAEEAAKAYDKAAIDAYGESPH